MKRIAILSLLLVPSAVVGVEQASAQAPTLVASHFDNQPAIDGEESLVRGQSCEPGVCGSLGACESTGGWFGDLGYYILTPQWGGGNPIARLDAGGAVEQVEFDHDSEFVPLASVGYAGANGLGFRSRFWKLNASDDVGRAVDATPVAINLLTPSLLGTGGALNAAVGTNVAANARHKVDLDVIDMEGLWETTIGRTSVLYSAGVRYAHLGQHYSSSASVTDAAGVVLAEGTFRGGHTFNGAGPTVSMQAYRTIGHSDFSLYGLGRGSVLFGEKRESAWSDVLNDTRSITNDAVLPVVEMEVGINWTRNMGGFDLFTETGFVGQVWFDAGNAANSDSLLAGTVGTGNSNQDMGLVGLRYVSGIRF